MPRKDPEAAKAYWREYRKTDAWKRTQVRYREKHKAWRNSPEGRDEYYNLNIRKLYGIDINRYRELFAAQHESCAICGKHQSELKKRLGIDHDHLTGMVRGLLCTHCNHGLGKFLDSPAVLEKALDYLLKYTILGGSKAAA